MSLDINYLNGVLTDATTGTVTLGLCTGETVTAGVVTPVGEPSGAGYSAQTVNLTTAAQDDTDQASFTENDTAVEFEATGSWGTLTHGVVRIGGSVASVFELAAPVTLGAADTLVFERGSLRLRLSETGF